MSMYYDAATRGPRLYCEVCEGRGEIAVRVHERGDRMTLGFGPTFVVPSMVRESSRSYPCPECRPGHSRLEVVRNQSVMDISYAKDPRYVEGIQNHLVMNLANAMKNSGQIQFDSRPGPHGLGQAMIATVGIVPKKAVEPVAKMLEQMEAKMTCMCGDYVNHHSMGSGHSPVSMYDHALSETEMRLSEAKVRIAQLESRLEQVFP